VGPSFTYLYGGAVLASSGVLGMVLRRQHVARGDAFFDAGAYEVFPVHLRILGTLLAFSIATGFVYVFIASHLTTDGADAWKASNFGLTHVIMEVKSDAPLLQNSEHMPVNRRRTSC
jgi:hypothetical protein